MRYNFTDDYKNEFKSYVDSLYKSDITEIEAKKREINSLTESYFAVTYEVPDSVQLDRLSTWLLKGENLVGDFHSEDQTKWRQRKKETTVPEVFNDELSLKRDGNHVTKTLSPIDSEPDNFTHVDLEYDSTNDKRRYNAPVRKISL